MTNPIFRLVCVVAVLAVAGCDRSTDTSAFEDDSGILKYVPADSAYVAVRLAPTPDEVKARLADANAASLAYNKAMLAEIAAATDGNPEAAAIRKVIELAQGLTTPGGLEQMGIDADAQIAIYDVGLMPVVRTGLKDVAAFQAQIDSLQAQFEFEARDGAIGEAQYQYLEAEEFRLVWTLADSQLVITASHADSTDDELAAQLGITLPAENIAETGTLAAIASDYGYTEQAIGFVDTLRVFDAMMNPTGLVETLSQGDPWQDAMSPTCRNEVRSALANVPRMVAGVSKADSDGIGASMVIELRDELANDLQGLAAVVPGLGLPSDALFSGGFSFDAKVARSFVESRLAEMAAAPYECEFLVENNAAVAQAQEFLARQPIPPTLNDFRGVYASLDGVDGADLLAGRPPASAEVGLILAMKNPESLTAMGALFLPEFKALGIQQDGEAREIPAGMFNPTGMPLWVSMSDNGIGLALGDNAKERLPDIVAMPGNPDAPLMGMDLNAGAYFELLSDMMSAEPDGNEVMVESFDTLMDELGRAYDRMSLTVDIHKKGLEFKSEVTFK